MTHYLKDNFLNIANAFSTTSTAIHIFNHESREKYVGSYVRVIQYYLSQLSWHTLEPATFLRWTVSLVQQKNLN